MQQRLQPSNLFRIKIITWLITFLVLSVGCSIVSQSEPSPTSISTQVEVTVTPIETQLESTQLFPQSMATAIPTLTPTVETSLYSHPDDIYQFAYPTTWNVIQGNDSITISDPNRDISAEVYVLDTLYELDGPSFLRLVEAREASAFRKFNDFHEFERQVDDDESSLIVKKEFTADDEEISVSSLYRQSGQMVVILDIRSDQGLFQETDNVFTNISGSLQLLDPDEADLAAMQLNLSKPYESDLFALVVPEYWNFKRISANNSFVDTFTSPGEHAVIQVAVFDDGEDISGAVAGAFVRNLLRNYYADDIVVTSDLLMADGREELIWKSSASGYQGKSYFDKRDTTLYIITVMIEDEYMDIYRGLIDSVLSSYDSQPVIEG